MAVCDSVCVVPLVYRFPPSLQARGEEGCGGGSEGERESHVLKDVVSSLEKVLDNETTSDDQQRALIFSLILKDQKGSPFSRLYVCKCEKKMMSSKERKLTLGFSRVPTPSLPSRPLLPRASIC